MKHNWKTKKPRKTQEGYLETARPTKATKRSKPRQRAKKSSKIKNSKLPLKQIPPNILNATSTP
jgi:hypothetical protein